MRPFLALLIVAAAAVTAAAGPPARLMSEKKESQLRANFPTVDDKDVQAILDADDLIIYTEREMPKAYQNSNTFHSPYYNIAALPDPFGNANRDFPWNETGGADLVRNLEVFRFAKFPKDKNGKYLPMVVWQDNLDQQPLPDGSSWRWAYPKGMVFGELMAMDAPNGYTYAFELRLRFRDGGSWDIDCFRPFPTAADLSKRVKELRPNWKSQPDLVKLINTLDGKSTFAKYAVVDNNRSRKAFASKEGAQSLPPIKDKDLVAELLTGGVWKSAHGETWKDGVNKVSVTAPTVNTGTGFHIVPENYRAFAFSTDSQGCMNCHNTTNHSARSFSVNREWYGRVRGSDGIFSFHPIAPSSISNDGGNRPVRFRQALEQAGLVEMYNPRRHPKSIYNTLSTMRE